MIRFHISFPRYLTLNILGALLVVLLAACGAASGGQGSGASPTTPAQTAAASPTVQAKQLSAPLVIYKGHMAGVISVAWSPDGKQIASASDDGTMQLWNAASGKRAWTYTFSAGGPKYLFAVAWSPDGRLIATGGQDGALIVLDATTGHVLHTWFTYSVAIQGIAWSPDGKRVAFGLQGDDSVRVWDIASGKQIVDNTGHTGSVNRIAWSPDGSEIASASNDGTVQIINAGSGQRILTYTVGTPLWSLAWSPDGKRIVCGTGAAGMDNPVYSGNTVKVFDAASGKTLLTYSGHSGQVYALAWSPNGQYIASAGDDKTVRIWSATTGQTLFTGSGFTDIVWSVAWSPDGKELAASSQDASARVWRIPL